VILVVMRSWLALRAQNDLSLSLATRKTLCCR
jgi:hypothetical protein